jgi:hypothetical protein
MNEFKATLKFVLCFWLPLLKLKIAKSALISVLREEEREPTLGQNSLTVVTLACSKKTIIFLVDVLKQNESFDCWVLDLFLALYPVPLDLFRNYHLFFLLEDRKRTDNETVTKRLHERRPEEESNSPLKLVSPLDLTVDNRWFKFSCHRNQSDLIL